MKALPGASPCAILAVDDADRSDVSRAPRKSCLPPRPDPRRRPLRLDRLPPMAADDGGGPIGSPLGPTVGAGPRALRARYPPEKDVPRPVCGALPHPDFLRLRRPFGQDTLARLRGAFPEGRHAVSVARVLATVSRREGRRPSDDVRRCPARARAAPPL